LAAEADCLFARRAPAGPLGELPRVSDFRADLLRVISTARRGSALNGNGNGAAPAVTVTVPEVSQARAEIETSVPVSPPVVTVTDTEVSRDRDESPGASPIGNFLLVTFDSCRYDVLRDARTPVLDQFATIVRAQTPANFTYAAHQAFFVG